MNPELKVLYNIKKRKNGGPSEKFGSGECEPRIEDIIQLNNVISGGSGGYVNQ